MEGLLGDFLCLVGEAEDGLGRDGFGALLELELGSGAGRTSVGAATSWRELGLITNEQDLISHVSNKENK